MTRAVGLLATTKFFLRSIISAFAFSLAYLFVNTQIATITATTSNTINISISYTYFTSKIRTSLWQFR